MSEEITTEITAEPAAAAAETTAPQSDKPAGYHPVEIETATPEQIQERMDYLYKQAKKSQKAERELSQLRQVAADQSKLLEELSSNMGAVVDHLQGEQIKESESSLKAQMKQALDTGDTIAYVDAQDKLLELKAQKNAPKPVKTETQKQAYGGERIAQDDVPDVTPQDATYIQSWMAEKDERGRTLRSWVNDDDPDYEAAVAETKSVFTNPRFSKYTIDQKLAEVDRRMGLSKPTGGQTVMGGNLTTRAKTNKVTLSPKQQEIAVKTRYGGKGKSDAEHIEAYRKQIERVQSQRGAR